MTDQITAILPSRKHGPFEPLDYDTIKKIVTLPTIEQITQETGRTPAAVQKVRYDYRRFCKNGNFEKITVSAPSKIIFEKLKEEGVISSAIERGVQRISYGLQESSLVPAEGEKKDPFAEYEILLSNFQRESKRLIQAMAQELVDDRMKEIGQLFTQAGKINITKSMKRFKKGAF